MDIQTEGVREWAQKGVLHPSVLRKKDKRLNYEEAVSYIADVPKFTKKNKPENTAELLARLGHPEEQYKIIHVAGTNGKGSVCAFTASILQEAGFRTGLFISPHLVKINERFQINQEPVSDQVFLEGFRTVKKAIDEMVAAGFSHPTYCQGEDRVPGDGNRAGRQAGRHQHGPASHCHSDHVHQPGPHRIPGEYNP